MSHAYCLFVSLIASFALLLRSGANDATLATNKEHARQKSCYCPIILYVEQQSSGNGSSLETYRYQVIFYNLNVMTIQVHRRGSVLWRCKSIEELAGGQFSDIRSLKV